MSDVTLEQVVQMIAQLSPEDRAKLLKRLQIDNTMRTGGHVTREMILAEHAQLLAAGAFENATNIVGRFEKPDFDLSDHELEAGIRGFATEWEQELDDNPTD